MKKLKKQVQAYSGDDNCADDDDGDDDDVKKKLGVVEGAFALLCREWPPVGASLIKLVPVTEVRKSCSATARSLNSLAMMDMIVMMMVMMTMMIYIYNGGVYLCM